MPRRHLSLEEVQLLVAALSPLPSLQAEPAPPPEVPDVVFEAPDMEFELTIPVMLEDATWPTFAPVDERQMRQRQREHMAAAMAAKRLMRDVLSREQLESFNRRKYFEVTTGRRRFRVTESTVSNIVEFDEDGFAFQTWCMVPSAPCPSADMWALQKMVLETSLETLDKVGVRNPLGGYPPATGWFARMPALH